MLKYNPISDQIGQGKEGFEVKMRLLPTDKIQKWGPPAIISGGTGHSGPGRELQSVNMDAVDHNDVHTDAEGKEDSEILLSDQQITLKNLR